MLSDDRRRDLVADLREHMESVLPQGFDDAAVRETLDRLGSPREIVAAAIAEEPGVQPLRPESGVRTAVTLGMAVPAALSFWGAGVGLVAGRRRRCTDLALAVLDGPGQAPGYGRCSLALPGDIRGRGTARLLRPPRGPELLGVFLIGTVIPLVMAVCPGGSADRLRPQAARSAPARAVSGRTARRPGRGPGGVPRLARPGRDQPDRRCSSSSRNRVHRSRSAVSRWSVSSCVRCRDGANRRVFGALAVGRTRTRCAPSRYPAAT